MCEVPVLIVVLALGLLLPAGAHAVTAVDVDVRVDSPCVAGSCEVRLTLVPDAPTDLAVDPDHRVADQDFDATVRVECAPAGSPDAEYSGVATTCRVTEVLRRAGKVVVAWQVSGEDGEPPTFARRTVTVKAGPASGGAGDTPPKLAEWQRLCRQAKRGDTCQDGGGRKVPGGGAKVSHKGWPAITGVFWQVKARRAGRRFTGGTKNDELLGRHGSDRILGRGGKDVIWGDWDPVDNNTVQRDVLDGGAGNDWLYTSHGRNTVRGGAGRDYVWAYYGRGTIDCGPGFDTLRIRVVNRYRHRNCERIKNFCSFGSKPGNAGGCYKPGEKPRTKR